MAKMQTTPFPKTIMQNHSNKKITLVTADCALSW